MRTSESLRCDLESRAEFSAFLKESIVAQFERVWPICPRTREEENFACSRFTSTIKPIKQRFSAE
jgi:hypothetical protein